MDRAHYVGESFIDNKKKKEVRSIIIKFSLWKSRTAF